MAFINNRRGNMIYVIDLTAAENIPANAEKIKAKGIEIEDLRQ
jgi:hypothetical protein